jgi:hypothetical protein
MDMSTDCSGLPVSIDRTHTVTNAGRSMERGEVWAADAEATLGVGERGNSVEESTGGLINRSPGVDDRSEARALDASISVASELLFSGKSHKKPSPAPRPSTRTARRIPLFIGRVSRTDDEATDSVEREIW